MAHEFRNKAVRDLAWTIASPSLLRPSLTPHGAVAVSDEWCQLAYRETEDWLRRLDLAPDALHQWLEEHPSRLLGVRFERLIGFWLSHWRRSRLLAAGVQVNSGQRAVGEFDFLWSDRQRRQTIHWEVAVKYYLQYTDSSGAVTFLGPNPGDTFKGKIGKLVSHQLRLSGRPEASPVLARLGAAPITAEAFVKGYLFYPSEGDWRGPAVAPERVSPAHLRGWWTFASRCAVPRNNVRSRWLVLPRLDWLAPARRDGEPPGLDWPTLREVLGKHFGGGARRPPVLLAELTPAGKNLWLECSRGFVVPDHWPASDGRSLRGGSRPATS